MLGRREEKSEKCPSVAVFPALRRFTQAGILALLGGSALGCLAGTPTIFLGYSYYLASVNMYTFTYYDLDRIGWPLFKNIKWFVNYYLHLIAPDYLTMAMIGLGTLLIVARRDRLALPVLAGGSCSLSPSRSRC